MSALTEYSVDPRTFDTLAVLPASTSAEITAATAAAQAAAGAVAGQVPAVRAGWLRAVADALTAQVGELVDLADAETGLGRDRLTGEVARCAAQLRFYADVAREGSWLGATIDHATDTTPDLRRVQVPLGPVAVFGASNFPFGFGTLGNDTASALAAGCTVVVKGHPAHPQTHARLIEVASSALTQAGAPPGTLGAVSGWAAGRELVLDPQVRAVAFTGSQAGGMALWSLAQTRPRVIPVFAEMGTVNPVVITGSAVAADLAAGCVASFTLGLGQFCTKPGLVLAPVGSGFTDALVDALHEASPRGVMLTGRIAASYAAGIDRLTAAGAELRGYVPDPDPGAGVSAVVLQASAALVEEGSPLLQECFGPVCVVVEYLDAAHRDMLLARLQPALVASVLTGGPHDPEAPGVIEQLAGQVGRVCVDGWPTGVATTWAQQHGGPWPATTVPAATSVGAAALARFIRPVAYQGAVGDQLPAPLREGNPWRIPRRVDGRLRVPKTSS